MEGYLIRLPVEACFPDKRPAWRQDPNGPVRSRVLYYVLEEGYLRGFESPDDVDESAECFQLTSHRIEVNVMNSLNIFEIKARAFTVPPLRHFEENTSSSGSSSDSESSSDDDDRGDMVSTFTPPVTISSTSKGVISGSFHIVFFAANKELSKKWSVKLLNWNRFVFGSADNLDEAALKLAKSEIIEALRQMNAANRFLRPVEVQNSQNDAASSDVATNFPPSAGIVGDITAQIDQSNASTTTDTSILPEVNEKICTSPPAVCTDPINIVRPSDPSTHSWWVVPFAKSRKISSYSLRR